MHVCIFSDKKNESSKRQQMSHVTVRCEGASLVAKLFDQYKSKTRTPNQNACSKMFGNKDEILGKREMPIATKKSLPLYVYISVHTVRLQN